MAFNQKFMLAVIELGGHQYIVSEKTRFRVDSKFENELKTLTCDKVLLLAEPDGKDFQIGTPYIKGMVVECKILAEGRAAKVHVVKMISKERHKRTHGHRQYYVDLEVVKIKKGEVKKEQAEDKPAVAVEVKKAVTKKVAAKKIALKE